MAPAQGWHAKSWKKVAPLRKINHLKDSRSNTLTTTHLISTIILNRSLFKLRKVAIIFKLHLNENYATISLMKFVSNSFTSTWNQWIVEINSFDEFHNSSRLLDEHFLRKKIERPVSAEPFYFQKFSCPNILSLF